MPAPIANLVNLPKAVTEGLPAAKRAFDEVVLDPSPTYGEELLAKVPRAVQPLVAGPAAAVSTAARLLRGFTGTSKAVAELRPEAPSRSPRRCSAWRRAAGVGSRPRRDADGVAAEGSAAPRPARPQADADAPEVDGDLGGAPAGRRSPSSGRVTARGPAARGPALRPARDIQEGPPPLGPPASPLLDEFGRPLTRGEGPSALGARPPARVLQGAARGAPGPGRPRRHRPPRSASPSRGRPSARRRARCGPGTCAWTPVPKRPSGTARRRSTSRARWRARPRARSSTRLAARWLRWRRAYHRARPPVHHAAAGGGGSGARQAPRALQGPGGGAPDLTEPGRLAARWNRSAGRPRGRRRRGSARGPGARRPNVRRSRTIASGTRSDRARPAAGAHHAGGAGPGGRGARSGQGGARSARGRDRRDAGVDPVAGQASGSGVAASPRPGAARLPHRRQGRRRAGGRPAQQAEVAGGYRARRGRSGSIQPRRSGARTWILASRLPRTSLPVTRPLDKLRTPASVPKLDAAPGTCRPGRTRGRGG